MHILQRISLFNGYLVNSVKYVNSVNYVNNAKFLIIETILSSMKPGLRVHIATVGFQVRRITEPLIRERADKVYLITHSKDDKAAAYLEKIMKILRKEKYLKIEKRAMNIWDLFECLETYKKIINDEEHEGDKNSNIFVNVSTGSKVSSIAGTMACMIWKGTPYYAHIEYNDKTDPEDGLPDEDVNAIDEIPVYSINKPKDESLVILKILSNVKGFTQNEEKQAPRTARRNWTGRQKPIRRCQTQQA